MYCQYAFLGGDGYSDDEGELCPYSTPPNVCTCMGRKLSNEVAQSQINAPRSGQMLNDGTVIKMIEDQLNLTIGVAKKKKWAQVNRQTILDGLKKKNMLFGKELNGVWRIGSNERMQIWVGFADDSLFNIKGGYKAGGYRNVISTKNVERPFILRQMQDGETKKYDGIIIELLAFKARVMLRESGDKGEFRENYNAESKLFDSPLYINNYMDWCWA
jgi:hypothetical protein